MSDWREIRKAEQVLTYLRSHGYSGSQIARLIGIPEPYVSMIGSRNQRIPEKAVNTVIEWGRLQNVVVGQT